MNLDLKSIKQIDRKQALGSVLKMYTDHNITMLFLIAGALIGFSLIRVQALTDLAASSATGNGSLEAIDSLEGDSPPVESLVKINLDEDTLLRLEELKDDKDVIIDSKLPDNRINPF